MARALMFNEEFEDLGDWTHRDATFADSRQLYSRGDPEAIRLTSRGAEFRIVRLGPALDGEERYGYGYIGTVGTVSVVPGDTVKARIQFNHYRGCHPSLWLQSNTPYGTPADYEADIEHFGAQNPYRRTGVDLHQNVYWRGEGQDFGQYTGIPFRRNSNEVLGPRTPWSDGERTYSIRVHKNGFSFRCGDKLLGRTFVAHEPRPMFICLSNISRDWEHEDLDAAFAASPEGPGVMRVRRVWVTRAAA